MKPQEMLRRACQKSLECYGMLVMPNFKSPRHVRYLCEKLEALERGKITRLAISLPPQHGKSTLCSMLFPSWFMGKRPGENIICATYGDDLAFGWGRRVRNIITDRPHLNVFPDSRLSADSTAAQFFTTQSGGSYYAVSRGGPITGRGCSLLVVDDILKDEQESRSDVVRRSVHDWYNWNALTRLGPGGRVLLVGTRWHTDDLIGNALREHADEGWEYIALPALAEEDDLLGREPGEPLWPERKSKQELEEYREREPAGFCTLYQGNPVARSGAIFHRDWFERRFDRLPEKFTRTVQSWDCAAKTGQANDYSVGCTLASTETGFYLLSVARGKWEFPELKRMVASQAQTWRPHSIVVEDASSGQSLVQDLKGATTFPVVARKPDRDKISRAMAIADMVREKLYLPQSAGWLPDFIDELAGFPGGAPHDDCVDALALGLNELRDPGFCYGLIGYLKGVASGKYPHPDDPTPIAKLQEPFGVGHPCPDASQGCCGRLWATGTAGRLECNACHGVFEVLEVPDFEDHRENGEGGVSGTEAHGSRAGGALETGGGGGGEGGQRPGSFLNLIRRMSIHPKSLMLLGQNWPAHLQKE
jgi:predicted phage terminase large subunit-like protein